MSTIKYKFICIIFWVLIYKKNHYPNYYELIKKINDINKIFNLLIENKIYGFKILFNLTNINNVITNQENIKNLILNEIKDFKININLVNNLI